MTETPEHFREEHANKTKKNRIITLRINRDILMVAVAVLLIVAAYFVGVNKGENKSKNTRKDGLASLTSRTAESSSNRWTSVGSVQEVSETAVKVKDSRGKVKDAKITKDTAIVDRTGTKLTTKDIKKDQRVIVSGTKDAKDVLTATRIRIQQ